MMFLRIVLFISVFTTVAYANCPITQNPQVIFDCLGFITRGLYGAVTQDVTMLCSVARDIANCTRQQLGDCIAAEIGRAALTEIADLSEHCCVDRNNPKCSIRDESIQHQQCFAADSLVTLADGKQKIIADLHSGDRVLAFDDQTKQIITTDVLTMLDNQPNQFAMFKQLTTVSGQQLSLTSTHLLPTDIDKYVMAKDIHVGMNIYVMNHRGELVLEAITDVIDVVKQGYIAPLTQQGTLMVNNIAASCYATINDHHLAHAVLAPMRWWYTLVGTTDQSNEMLGVHWFPNVLYQITNFFMPSIIQN